MRQLVHSLAAAFVGFLAIATMLKGDLWGAWSYGALAAFIWLGPTLLVPHAPRQLEASPLDPWIRLPNAPTASPFAPLPSEAEIDPADGVIGATPSATSPDRRFLRR